MSTGLVVTRFAPSPTGHLHVGGARSALFCWAYARRRRADGLDGRFMIRIEDTDQARSSDESARGILDDLAWLGLVWDDGPEHTRPDGSKVGGDSRHAGPYFQARRVPIYDAYIESLVRAGRAYPAFEPSEELESRRKAAVAAKRTYRYERPADVKDGEFNAARWARAKSGEPHVVRFLSRAEEIVVPDQVLGDVRIAAGELDDFVIRKADGFPTYHFAVVIDDELMGVTHVMRAQEHLANTPRHVAMQKALTRLVDDRDAGKGTTGAGFRTPVYAHMPLIFNMDGSKMSKRDKAKAARKAAKDAMGKDPSLSAAELSSRAGIDAANLSAFVAGENDSIDVAEALARVFGLSLPEVEVWDYRRSGYLPEAIINFVALLGWNPGLKGADGKDVEKFDMAFLAEHFSIERIGRTNAKFDRAKLLSFNADYLSRLSDADFARRWTQWMREHEPSAREALRARGIEGPRLEVLAKALKPRAKTFRDALKPAGFALVADDGYSFDAAAIDKHVRGDGRGVLVEIRDRLAALPAWNADSTHAVVESLAKERGLPNPGAIAQPLRVALTGTGVSPGLGETMAVLGRESTLARIDRCLRHMA